MQIHVSHNRRKELWEENWEKGSKKLEEEIRSKNKRNKASGRVKIGSERVRKGETETMREREREKERDRARESLFVNTLEGDR